MTTESPSTESPSTKTGIDDALPCGYEYFFAKRTAIASYSRRNSATSRPEKPFAPYITTLLLLFVLSPLRRHEAAGRNKTLSPTPGAPSPPQAGAWPIVHLP